MKFLSLSSIEVLQTSDHLCDLLSLCSKRSMSVPFWRDPELDVTLQVGSHKGRAGQNALPWCAGHTAVDAAQDAVDLVCNCTKPGHAQVFLHQNLPNPPPQGWFQWVYYSISTHVWDCPNSGAAAWTWTCWVSLGACGSCLPSLSKSPGWHCFLLLWWLHNSACCHLKIFVIMLLQFFACFFYSSPLCLKPVALQGILWP